MAILSQVKWHIKIVLVYILLMGKNDELCLFFIIVIYLFIYLFIYFCVCLCVCMRVRVHEYVCMCVRVHDCVCHSTQREARGLYAGIVSLPLPCDSW